MAATKTGGKGEWAAKTAATWTKGGLEGAIAN